MNIEKVMDWLDATCTPESHAAFDEIAKLTKQRDDLLTALELADAALSGANMNMSVVENKVKAAIASVKESK